MPVVHDVDFHPRQARVRVFDNPPSGVRRADEDAFVSEATYAGDVVLRHYAFRDRWFKVNLTVDAAGRPTETALAPGAPAYAFNIDIATPMLFCDNAAYAVDLELDVMVKADARTYDVVDLTDFEESATKELISPGEVHGALAGLAELIELIERGTLMSMLASACPPGPPGAAPPVRMREVPLADVPQLQPGKRLTWARGSEE
ncbi:MAG: hypothetical protein ACRDP8_08040 [Actinopolymorphaceae bacterium]